MAIWILESLLVVEMGRELLIDSGLIMMDVRDKAEITP